jgi:hypothetical protein
MLKLATPGLDSLGGANETEKRFKALLAMVHPDKHPQATPRANSLCQMSDSFTNNVWRIQTHNPQR